MKNKIFGYIFFYLLYIFAGVIYYYIAQNINISYSGNRFLNDFLSFLPLGIAEICISIPFGVKLKLFCSKRKSDNKIMLGKMFILVFVGWVLSELSYLITLFIAFSITMSNF